jgi:hypothetical protein
MNMAPANGPRVQHRSEAISRLREGLSGLIDGERSLCAVAAENGIFCRGFQRWNDWEFDRRSRCHIGRSTHLSRAQMERYAELHVQSVQIRSGQKFACDALALSPGLCRGWNEFSNAELARFCNDILGEDVDVVD